MITLEERQILIKDAIERFPNISDEELERIGCMRVQYLAPSWDGKSIQVYEWFDAIPFELLSKKNKE